VAKPNYSFQKRQRELAKKQKKEERQQQKIQRKAASGNAQHDQTAESSPPANADADAGAGNT
jgi:hypothetical protein